METKKVIKTLLKLRDELYLNDQITMNGVWKLNGIISKIQEETGIDEEEIGYTAPDLSTYLDEDEEEIGYTAPDLSTYLDENICKFNQYIECVKCDNCENCAWNPDNKYLRTRRVRKAVRAFFEEQEAEGVRKNIQNGEKNGKS